MTKRATTALTLFALCLALLAVPGCSKPKTGPGSDAWRTQSRAYITVFARVNRDAVADLGKQSNSLRAGSKITSEQALFLMTGASEALSKSTSQLEAVKPPTELANVHADQLKFLTLAQQGVEKQAAGVQAGDAELIAEGQALLKQAQSAQNRAQGELKVFTTTYNDKLK
jgi:hypothetical protein